MKKIIPFYMIYLSCQDNPTNSHGNNPDPELDTKKQSSKSEINKYQQENKKEENLNVPTKKERIVKSKEELEKLKNDEFEKLFEERINEDIQEYLEEYKCKEIREIIEKELKLCMKYMKGEQKMYNYGLSKYANSSNEIQYENKLEILTNDENAIQQLMKMYYIRQNFFPIIFIKEIEKEINNLSEKDSYKVDLMLKSNNIIYWDSDNKKDKIVEKIIEGKNKEKIEKYIGYIDNLQMNVIHSNLPNGNNNEFLNLD